MQPAEEDVRRHSTGGTSNAASMRRLQVPYAKRAATTLGACTCMCTCCRPPHTHKHAHTHTRTRTDRRKTQVLGSFWKLVMASVRRLGGMSPAVGGRGLGWGRAVRRGVREARACQGSLFAC